MIKTKEILFGGLPEAPSDDIFKNAQANNPEWYKIIEAAMHQFRAMPENKGILPENGAKGATLEQAWNVYGLYGNYPYCLLSDKQPKVDTGKIEKVIRVTPSQFVQTLKQINNKEGELNSMQFLHYDGHTGHCINLKHYDVVRDRFVYHDPWPVDSLLCEKNNMASVNAIPDQNKWWSITAKEMESVAFAAFVQPAYWDRMQNNLKEMLLSDFFSGDFFTFFNLKEIGKYDHDETREVQYSPQNFQGIVVIAFLLNKTGRIEEAKLIMNKHWMKENFLLVPDLCISFLKTFIPEPDTNNYSSLLTSMQPQNFNKIIPRLVKEGSGNMVLNEVLLAYAGAGDSARLPASYSSLYVETITFEDVPFLQLNLNLI